MVPSATQTLWDEALQNLDEEERTRYDLILTKGSGHRAVLEDVLIATLEKKEECKTKRWKVVIKGKTVILRDLLEKVAVWINKFIAVGDSVVQYDPGHAALPWAAIRFILRATINEVEIFGAVLQVVETISNALARGKIMESLYLYSNFEVSDRLRQGLIDLYATILIFLAKSVQYYNQSTMKRIAKSIVSMTDVATWSQPIEEHFANVNRLMTLAEAERAQQIANNLTQVRTSQIAQGQKLETTYLALKQLSDQLMLPISRIDEQITNFKDDLERKTRAAIIKSISTINFVAQHKVANGGLLPGSGKWFLNKPQFKEWRDESCSSVLWLHGIPGSGKTKLTSMVVTELKPTSHVVYFYCARNPGEPERSECDHILASLVRQLACPSPGVPIMRPVLARYEDAIDELVEFSEISWSRDEAIRLLIELCDWYPAIILVIDALDEVNSTNRLDLLDGLLEILDKSQALIKIFISSRENMDIVDRLESTPNLRIGAKENTEDIANFVIQQLKVANLLHGRLPISLKEKIPETLVEGAQGMFRWVDLQIQSLRPLKVAADIEARLGRLPQTLEESYLEILDHIQVSGEYAFKLAIFTFQWLLYARKPIALADFRYLAYLNSGQRNVYTTHEILDVCQNLVVCNDAGIFRFVHLSVREFLERTGQAEIKGRRIPYFSVEEANAAIGSASLSYLRFTMNSESSKVDSHLSLSRQMKENTALRDYTANYWPFHISKSGHLKSSAPLSLNVHSFMIKDRDVAPTFAHWCKVVTEDMGSAALEDIKEAAELPANPIWLAHTYDIISVHSVSIDDKNRRSKAFVYAASKGNCRVMSALLDQGLDVKDVGIEAMGQAISAAQSDAVTFLLDYQVPVDPTWLLQATISQHSKVVTALVSKGSRNFTGKDLLRAFRIAVASGDYASVSAFLEANIEKDPLAVVRALKAATSMAALHLINIGFDVHGTYLLEERTALHWACERGFLNVVEVLLDKEVKVNLADAWGNTPLHLAVWKGRLEVVNLLLEHGTVRYPINRDGQIPLHLASMMGYATIVQKLYFGPAELEAKDNSGMTALMYAETYGRKEVVTFLHGQSALAIETSQEYIPDTSTGAPPIPQDLANAGPRPIAKVLVCDHKSSPLQTSDAVAPLGEVTTETKTSDPPRSKSHQPNTLTGTPLCTETLTYAHFSPTSSAEEDKLQIEIVRDTGDHLSELA